MKILFVCSGNSKEFPISPFIKAQGDELQNFGLEITYCTVKGKGVRGYLKSMMNLRKYLNNNYYDLIHAHYSLCGLVSFLASWRVPVVLSYMGDDINGTYIRPGQVKRSSYLLYSISYFLQPFVKAIIIKSANMQRNIFRKSKCHVIPNGVKLDHFFMTKDNYRSKLKLDNNKSYILFLGDPYNLNKNIRLIKNALTLINDPSVELLNPYPISHNRVVDFLNAVDVLALPSLMEGSPNVVKEAMACNCPIVATDVGDVKWIVGEVEGCYTASFEPEGFAEKIQKALKFAHDEGRTNGRDRIIELGLDSRTVAKRIIEVYEKVLN